MNCKPADFNKIVGCRRLKFFAKFGLMQLVNKILNTRWLLLILVLVVWRPTLFCQPPPTPSITITNSNAIPFGCSNQGVVLVSSASTGNIWSNGANTQTITVFTAGTYSVVQVVGTATSAPSAPVSVTICTVKQPSIGPIGPICNNSSPVPILYAPGGTAAFSGLAVYGGGTSPPMFNPAWANTTPQFPTTTIFLNLTQLCPNSDYRCVGTASLNVVVNICNDMAENENPGKPVYIYPNPSNDKATIHTNHKVSRVSITDLSARVIYDAPVLNDEDISLDLKTIFPGIYFVILELENRKIYSRLIKQ